VAWTVDAVGMQARRVGDVARLFAALAGGGRGRSADAGARGAGGAARGGPPKLGVVRDPLLDRADDEVQRATERAVDMLRGAGADTAEVPLDGALELALAAHRVVVFCECAAVHEELLAQHAERLGPRARTLLELGTVTPATDYLRARRLRRRLAGRLQAAFDGVDALLTPTTSGPAPADLDSTGDPSFQIPWTFAGLPAISLPIGLGERGMPLAVQLAGPRGADERLLEVARWCERALDVSLRPTGGKPPPEDG
jgi:aspartyl-tRNA(Asn)/glutamyl-tRNA(Gln) amidotransferase subunit A